MIVEASRVSTGNLDFEQFRIFLEKACGILLGTNKQYLVSSRLNKLQEQHGIKTLGELVQRMQSQPRSGLREQVVDAMTTNETLWFRDTYPFEGLKNRVLPEMIKASPGQRIRIWSAACSSGQEPYSLSMSIDEFEKTNIGQLKAGVQIVATDLSPSMLANCKSGEYDSLGKFDIVFCRNVLIYFSADMKKDILTRIHAMLKPGGYLFLGASEALNGLPNHYQMVQCSPGIIYKAK